MESGQAPAQTPDKKNQQNESSEQKKETKWTTWATIAVAVGTVLSALAAWIVPIIQQRSGNRESPPAASQPAPATSQPTTAPKPPTPAPQPPKPVPQLISGQWWGTGEDTKFSFSGNNKCAWDATISNITISAKFTKAQKLESALLKYNYIETPRVAGCGTGEGYRTGVTTNTAVADSIHSKVSTDKVDLMFPAGQNTHPVTKSAFIGGRTDDQNTIKGVLTIERIDHPEFDIDWKEDLSMKLEKKSR